MYNHSFLVSNASNMSIMQKQKNDNYEFNVIKDLQECKIDERWWKGRKLWYCFKLNKPHAKYTLSFVTGRLKGERF